MKSGATDSGIIPYAGSQDSDLASGQDLPAKRPRTAESTKELEDNGEPQDEVEDQLVILSEAASAFLGWPLNPKLTTRWEGQKLRNLEYQTHDGPDAQISMQLYRQISLETLRELITALAVYSNFGWTPWLQLWWY